MLLSGRPSWLIRKVRTDSPTGIRPRVIVEHPAYLVLPKISMTDSLSRCIWPPDRCKANFGKWFDFKLIDAHYFYPDGVAAILLGREFGVRYASPPGHRYQCLSQLPVATPLILCRTQSPALSLCPEPKDSFRVGVAGIKLELANALIRCSGREILRLTRAPQFYRMTLCRR